MSDGSTARASEPTSAVPSSSTVTEVDRDTLTTAPGMRRARSTNRCGSAPPPPPAVTTKSEVTWVRASVALASSRVAVVPISEAASATVTITGAATAAVRRRAVEAFSLASTPVAPGS